MPSGVRPFTTMIGPVTYYKTLEPSLTGLYLVPGDLPTTVQSATFQIAAQADQAGADIDRVPMKVSGTR